MKKVYHSYLPSLKRIKIPIRHFIRIFNLANHSQIWNFNYIYWIHPKNLANLLFRKWSTLCWFHSVMPNWKLEFSIWTILQDLRILISQMPFFWLSVLFWISKLLKFIHRTLFDAERFQSALLTQSWNSRKLAFLTSSPYTSVTLYYLIAAI